MLEIISKELHESAKIRGQLIAFQFNNTMRSKRQAIDRRRLRRRIDVSSQRTIRRRHAIPSGSADAFDRAWDAIACRVLTDRRFGHSNGSRGESDRADGGRKWPKRGEVVATPPRRGFPLPSFTALRCFLLCPWNSSDYLPPRSALAGRTGGGSIAVLADPARRDQALSRPGPATVDRLQGAALPICRGGLGAVASDAEG